MARRRRDDDVPILPYWTAQRVGSGSDGGIWPLGLEQIGLRLTAAMIPGLTNQTIHIRYYSMFAWAYWKFAKIAQSRGRDVTSDEQEAWFRRVENVFRVASELAEPQRSALAGSRVIRRHWDEIDRPNGRVSLDDDEAFSAWVPYGASFLQLRCGDYFEGVVRLLSPTGEAIAKAFDEQLRSSAPGRALIAQLESRAKYVDVDLVRKVLEQFALRHLQEGEPEHQALLAMLAPHSPRRALAGLADDDRDVARSRTVGLFLDLARESAGSLSSYWDVHRVFASGVCRGDSAYRPPAVFERDYLRWQRYQERQHLKLAVYGIWRDVLDLLAGQRGWWASVEGIESTILDHATKSAVLADWCGKNPLAVKVEAALERVLRRVRSWEDHLTTAPFTLSTELIGTRTIDAGPATGLGLATLLATVAEWQERVSAQPMPADVRGIHRWDGRRRLALETLRSDITERKELSVGELLKWALATCVLGQSLHVAVDKFVDQGQDRFFIAPEGNGYQLVQRQEFRNLGYDGGRILSLFRLMEGLDLVSEENGVRITPAGKRALKAISAYHERTSRAGDLAAVAR